MSDDEVYEKYQELVYRLAVARTKQPSDADDVFQNVFYTYFKKKPKFKDEEHAKAWFIKVTINAAKKMYSRHEFTKRADMEDSDLENTISDNGTISQDSASPIAVPVSSGMIDSVLNDQSIKQCHDIDVKVTVPDGRYHSVSVYNGGMF